MAGSRLKAVCYLDQIKGGMYLRGSRGAVRVLDSQGRFCVCNRSEFVYIYQRDSGLLEIVYRLPSSVWQVEVDRKSEQLFVLCTGSGIYSILLNQKSSFSKETGAQESLLDASQLESNCGRHVPRICAVSAERCIVRDSAVCSFIVLGDVIVTVAKEDQKWRMTFLRIPAIGCEVQMCRKIQDIDFAFHPNLPHGEKSPESNYPPVLCCIYPQTAKDSKEWEVGDDHFCLESSLFSLLFSVDASMLNSPIVLCGLPDGQVCFVPMRYARSEAKGHASRMTVLHHVEQPVVFIGAVTLKQEGNDDQDHQSTSMDKPLISDSIIVIGKSGKVVIIQRSLQMEMWLPNFIEYHLRGPIVSACCRTNTLYYSTCSDFFSVELVHRDRSSAVAGRTADERNNQFDDVLPSILAPISLIICGVVAISTPSLTAKGDVDLIALTEKGKVMVCTLPHSSSAAQSVKLKAATAGQRIKDLLSGIGSVSDRIASLKRVMQQKDKALKGLNQDLNICCVLLSNQESQEKGMVPSKRQISCCVTARWNRLLLQDSLVISCILENLSAWPLEHRWSLCVKLITQTSALTKGSDSTAFTYAFPISELAPGKKMEVTVPLNSESDSFIALPVSVHCFLYYSLNASELPLSHSSLLSPRLSESDGICLPLNTHVIDLLDCLHIHGGGATEMVPPLNNNHKPSTSDPLEIFLHSFICSETNGVKGSEKLQEPFSVSGSERTAEGPFSASVKLSSDLVKVAVKDLGTGNAAENGSDVLQWLLSANSEVETVRMQSLPVVNCTAPDGSSIRILTKQQLDGLSNGSDGASPNTQCILLLLLSLQVAVANFSVDGPLSAVEIVMECSSLTMFCFLHQALTRRVQMLLEQSSPSSDSLPGLRVQCLRQLLHNVQALLKEVQSLRDQLCLGAEMNMSGTAAKLLQLYRQLRSTDLVIV
ncbi:Fanconi anemia core complex-associated protein 100 isoform X2 [Heterodontus francisci]|uniref:Fanconi anemia core complex-associated protein 100 isoform X2 n=1 Tax=Heterodontus francisci TaxID=7792 RepID=UPI00355B0DA5